MFSPLNTGRINKSRSNLKIQTTFHQTRGFHFIGLINVKLRKKTTIVESVSCAKKSGNPTEHVRYRRRARCTATIDNFSASPYRSDKNPTTARRDSADVFPLVLRPVWKSTCGNTRTSRRAERSTCTDTKRALRFVSGNRGEYSYYLFIFVFPVSCRPAIGSYRVARRCYYYYYYFFLRVSREICSPPVSATHAHAYSVYAIFE